MELVSTSNYTFSLSKLFDSPVKDIHVYASNEFGSTVLVLSSIEFEDGTEYHCGGEHDMPYIEVPSEMCELLKTTTKEEEE